MAKNSMTVQDLVGKVMSDEHADFLLAGLRAFVKEFMEVEVERLAGAGRHERSDERRDHRNGTRDRRWDTRVGTIDLEIPRLRQNNYVPSFLEPRRRSEQALVAVIQEAYVHGVSTRKVEDLVKAMGVASCSKSEVSRLCQALDEQVDAFRNRPLTLRYPYVWLDATFKKVRIDGSVVSNAVVVAYGVTEDGFREVLGVAVGGAECEAFWLEFLRSLVARGLSGVKLVISDAHQGLKNAIAQVFAGSAWQRCWVHFLRNVNGRVSKAQAGMVAEAVKTIFAQPNAAAARAQLASMAKMLRAKHPVVAQMLEEAEDDVLAYMNFPEAHWKQIRSTNPLERLNKEIGRRCDVVGIFPNQAALLRLVAMVLIEQNDEWQVGRRYMSQESLAALFERKEVKPAALPVPQPLDDAA